MQYRFTSMASLADYLATRGTMWRESAASTEKKSKRALLLERAVSYETIADMIRNTVVGADKDVIVLNAPKEK